MKLPWVKWFAADWLAEPELAKTSLEARGLWAEVLNLMFHSDSETLTGTPDQLSRMLRCLPSEFASALENLSATTVAEIEQRNGVIKFTCRRLQREAAIRRGGRNRSAKLRERGGGDPERWAAIRVDILRRDNYLCAYCGNKARTVDHVYPKARGGTEDSWNLVSACMPCNVTKSKRTPQEAGMKFHKTFNSSHLENSNRNITLSASAYASASDSDPLGKGDARGKGFPVTVDDALAQCALVAVPPEFVSHCFDKGASRGGVDARNCEIRDFPAYVRTEWRYQQDRKGREAATNGHPPANGATTIVKQKELDRVIERLRLIRGNYGDHQTWSKMDSDEWAKLTTRKKELKAELGVKV